MAYNAFNYYIVYSECTTEGLYAYSSVGKVLIST